MEFTKHIGSIHAYLEQLLKTATGGNVTVAYALHVARMQLSCRICGMTLTAPEPEGSSDLDYGVQKFIKLHAHAGGHGDKPSQDLVWKGGKYGEYVPLTCDFKPVGWDSLPTKHPLPIEGAGMIDEKFKNVQVIENRMKQYDIELAMKMDDEALAHKIALLQVSVQSQGVPTQVANTVDLPVQNIDIEKQKMELQALKNVFLVKQLQAVLSGQHAVPPKRASRLKIATGRKFK